MALYSSYVGCISLERCNLQRGQSDVRRPRLWPTSPTNRPAARLLLLLGAFCRVVDLVAGRLP
jgi:hypothetical protein